MNIHIHSLSKFLCLLKRKHEVSDDWLPFATALPHEFQCYIQKKIKNARPPAKSRLSTRVSDIFWKSGGEKKKKKISNAHREEQSIAPCMLISVIQVVGSL